MSRSLSIFAQGLADDFEEGQTKQSFFWSSRNQAQRDAERRMRNTLHTTGDLDEATEEEEEREFGTWHPTVSGLEDEDDEDDDGPVGPTRSINFQLTPVPTTFRPSPLESRNDLSRMARDAGMKPDLYVADQLVRQYKADPSQENMEYLFAHYKRTLLDPTVQRYTRRRLPEPAVRGRVYNNFAEAVKAYNPDNPEGKTLHEYVKGSWFRAGAAIAGESGHGVAKWADRYSRVGAINHERMNKLQKYQALQESSTIALGREADAAEIQQQTGWKLKDIATIMQESMSDHISSRNMQDQREDRGLQYRMALERAREKFSRPERALVDDIINYQLTSDSDRKAQGLSLGRIGAKYGYSNSQVTAVHNRLQAEILAERNAFLRYD